MTFGNQQTETEEKDYYEYSLKKVFNDYHSIDKMV